MSQIQRLIEGTVLKLCCDACGARFSHFQFSGEDDAATDGLFSAACCDEDALVVVDVFSMRLNLSGDLESTINAALVSHLKRDGFRVVRLIRTEEQGPSAAGMGFQDFLKAYSPPRLFFSCPCCPGESHVLEEIVPSDFLASGGTMRMIGNLVLR